MFRLVSVIIALLLSTSVLAQTDRWRFSGFGSLGAGRLQDKDLEYLGYDSEAWKFKSDSVLGLHLSGDLAERLALNMQIVARGYNLDDTDSFEPELDWLFLGYQLDSNWRIRLGRMRTPHYLYSETIDVGYSYVWARPPMDVYAAILAPFSNFDGADINYVADFDDLSIDVQLFAGHMERSRNNLHIEVNPMVGGNIKLQHGPYTLRYGLIYDNTYIQLGIDETDQNNLDAVIELDPSYQLLEDALCADDAWYRYQTLGLRWQQGSIAISAEAFDIRNTEEGYTNDAHGWYLSGQMQFGDVTPYLVYGYFDNEYNQHVMTFLDESLQNFPAGQDGYAAFDAFRYSTYSALKLGQLHQKTWTIGLRYDAFANVAIKAEWMWLDFTDGNTGQILQTTPETPANTSLATIVVDVVF